MTPKSALAQPSGALDEGAEDRLQVDRRARDDPQDLGRRRLLLQRLGRVAVALLQLLEQAGVLDGDDGLVGERLQQLDLPLGERLDLVAAVRTKIADDATPSAAAAPPAAFGANRSTSWARWWYSGSASTSGI